MRAGSICRKPFGVFSRLIVALVVTTVSVCSAHALSSANTYSSASVSSSSSDLLTQALSLKQSDAQASEAWANKALRAAIQNQDHSLIAKAHMLLAELANTSKNFEQAKHHYLQASLSFKSLNDKTNQIKSTIEYANQFFAEKSFDQGFQVLDKAIADELGYSDDWSMSMLLTTKGNVLYDQKKYADAITVFTESFKYLTGQDVETQTRLGLTYHQIGQAHKKLKHWSKSVAFHKNALGVFTRLDNKKLLARAYKNVAIAEHNRDNNLIALDYLLHGLEIQKQLNDRDEQAEMLMLGGMIYRDIERYEKALEYINRANQMYAAENNTARVAESSNQMGHLYTRLNKYDQARSFYQVTISLPEDKVAAKTLASASREIASIDLNSGNLEYAMQMAKKAYAIYLNIDDKVKASSTTRIIGQIYEAQNDRNKAIASFRESLKYAGEAENKKYQIKALNILGRSLSETNSDEAVRLLKRSLALATQANISADKLSTYTALRKVEKNRGNYFAALKIAENELALAKVIYKKREEKKLAQAKAQLDSHTMEMELDALREKVKLDSLALAQKNSEIEIVQQASRISDLELTKNRYASILLATLLVIAFSAVIYIYRIFVASRNRNKELDYLATRDPLTNCYNRRVLFDLMERDFTDYEKLDEYSIIMADIDHFKEINDTHGHNVGDEVLKAIAGILLDCVRQSDVTARYGGEEFCIILPGASEDQAVRIAREICNKIAAARFNDISVTCSFGVSSIKYNAKTPTEFISQADVALYKSKASGRNQVAVWSPKFGQSSYS